MSSVKTGETKVHGNRMSSTQEWIHHYMAKHKLPKETIEKTFMSEIRDFKVEKQQLVHSYEWNQVSDVYSFRITDPHSCSFLIRGSLPLPICRRLEDRKRYTFRCHPSSSLCSSLHVFPSVLHGYVDSLGIVRIRDAMNSFIWFEFEVDRSLLSFDAESITPLSVSSSFSSSSSSSDSDSDSMSVLATVAVS
jgi:hypothetical protein